MGMYYHRFKIKQYHIALVGDEKGLSQLMIDNETRSIVLKVDWKESEEIFVEVKQQLIQYLESNNLTSSSESTISTLSAEVIKSWRTAMDSLAKISN